MIIAMILGAGLFIAIMSLLGYSVKKIRNSEKLNSLFKKFCWVGVGLLFFMMITSCISKESNMVISLVFINYLKFVYSLTISIGVFYIVKNIYEKVKLKILAKRLPV